MTETDYSLLIGRLEGKIDGLAELVKQYFSGTVSLEKRVRVLEESRLKMLGAAMFAGGSIAFAVQLKPWTFFS